MDREKREKIRNSDKWTIVRAFEQKNGSRFIQLKEIAKLLDVKTPRYAREKYLKGLETYGGGKLYYFPDVLDRLRDKVT